MNECEIHHGALPCAYWPCDPNARPIPDVPEFPPPATVVEGVAVALQPKAGDR